MRGFLSLVLLLFMGGGELLLIHLTFTAIEITFKLVSLILFFSFYIFTLVPTALLCFIFFVSDPLFCFTSEGHL